MYNILIFFFSFFVIAVVVLMATATTEAASGCRCRFTSRYKLLLEQISETFDMCLCMHTSTSCTSHHACSNVFFFELIPLHSKIRIWLKWWSRCWQVEKCIGCAVGVFCMNRSCNSYRFRMSRRSSHSWHNTQRKGGRGEASSRLFVSESAERMDRNVVRRNEKPIARWRVNNEMLISWIVVDWQMWRCH